jgi:PAS domain S-box-containing protein
VSDKHCGVRQYLTQLKSSPQTNAVKMLPVKTSDSQILSFVMQATNDGIWDWDLVSGYIYFAPRYKAMLGYADNEFNNSMDEKLAHIHPEDSNREAEMMRQYLAHELPEYKDTYRMRHKDGSWRWIMSRAVAQWDAKGKPYRMIGSHTDITEQKALEQALTDAQ